MGEWFSVSARWFDGIHYCPRHITFADDIETAQAAYDAVELDIYTVRVTLAKFTDTSCEIIAEKNLQGHGGENGIWVV